MVDMIRVCGDISFVLSTKTYYVYMYLQNALFKGERYT